MQPAGCHPPYKPGPRMAVSKRCSRRCMTASIATPGESKAHMFEQVDVRVGAGPLGAKSAAQSSRYDVGEIVMTGAMALPTLAVTKVGRSPWRRAESKQGCQSKGQDTGFRIVASRPPE